LKRHLSRCKCIKTNKGIFGDAVTGTRLLLAHLRSRGAIAAAPPVPSASNDGPISDRFADRMLRHRGVVPRTNDRYQRALRPFIEMLGEDPKRYTVVAIRGYIVKRLDDVGRGETRDAVAAFRAFLRFPVAEGRVPSGIQDCGPTAPQWRL
jgi:hypothetical protein